MLGYDWPRLHAALNDLPVALLLVAVLFDLLAVVTKRPSFRQVGVWTMLVGAVGGALAVLSGLQAEEHIAHGEAVHRVMETHEQLGLITLGVFGVLTLWRIVRERRMGARRAGAEPGPLDRRSGSPGRHRRLRRQAGIRARRGNSDRGVAGRATGKKPRTTITAPGRSIRAIIVDPLRESAGAALTSIRPAPRRTRTDRCVSPSV